MGVNFFYKKCIVTDVSADFFNLLKYVNYKGICVVILRFVSYGGAFGAARLVACLYGGMRVVFLRCKTLYLTMVRPCNTPVQVVLCARNLTSLGTVN